jgi:hypothetical protein
MTGLFAAPRARILTKEVKNFLKCARGRKSAYIVTHVTKALKARDIRDAKLRAFKFFPLEKRLAVLK